MNHTPLKRLQGAALTAAIAASERQLGPAEIEVEVRAAELDAALRDGRNTNDARQALILAIKQRDRFLDEITQRQDQLEQRRITRIAIAAEALVAAANASTSHLLAGYEFQLN